MENARKIEILKKARDLIIAGWCRGSFSRFGASGDECSYCTIGAVGVAAGGTPGSGAFPESTFPSDQDAREVSLELAWTLGIPGIGSDLVSVFLWNDAAIRTQADVVGLYNRTIERLESAE